MNQPQILGSGASALLTNFYPERVTVEARVRTQDESGQELEEWEVVASCVDLPAAVAPVMIGATLDAMVRRLDITFERSQLAMSLNVYAPEIEVGMRVVFRGRRLGIDAVEHDSRNVRTRLRTEALT